MSRYAHVAELFSGNVDPLLQSARNQVRAFHQKKMVNAAREYEGEFLESALHNAKRRAAMLEHLLP